MKLASKVLIVARDRLQRQLPAKKVLMSEASHIVCWQ